MIEQTNLVFFFTSQPAHTSQQNFVEKKYREEQRYGPVTISISVTGNGSGNEVNAYMYTFHICQEKIHGKDQP